MYVFAPDDDSSPDLSKMFSGKPLSKSRKALVAFSCDQCGFVEFYSQTMGRFFSKGFDDTKHPNRYPSARRIQ